MPGRHRREILAAQTQIDVSTKEFAERLFGPRGKVLTDRLRCQEEKYLLKGRGAKRKNTHCRNEHKNKNLLKGLLCQRKHKKEKKKVLEFSSLCEAGSRKAKRWGFLSLFLLKELLSSSLSLSLSVSLSCTLLKS